jgi:RimJ/RimL family protein N-acetyltransferase
MTTIETARLLLRPPMADDLAPWGAMLADPEASRFIGGVQSENGAWRNLALMAGSWTVNGYSNFSVIEKASGRWIGRAGPVDACRLAGTGSGLGL